MGGKGRNDRDRIALACEDVAREFGVVGAVHPEDMIFQFCLNHDCFGTSEEAVKYYFWQGCESARKLAHLVAEYFPGDDGALELLEFASGYGAVTRHLRKILPAVKVTACDIHEKAVAFIREVLATDAELSSHDPESLSLPKKYDVVFALSFFSHMPEKTWQRWLLSLADQVKDDGLLIFTTHGEVSRKHFNYPAIGENGFWFKPVSEQGDLDVSEYGMTITLEKFVRAAIDQVASLSLCFYEEAYWWEHQDVYVLKKRG